MEYVGRRVKKEVSGLGTLFGSVQAHEPDGGVFTVVYDDGSSEDLNLEELLSWLVPSEASSLQASGSTVRESGSGPKKRRCIGNEGNYNDNFVIESGITDTLVAGDGNSMEFDLNLNKGLDLNDEGFNTLTDDDHGVNSVGVGARLGDLDLNEVVNLEMDEGLDLRNGGIEGDLGKKEIIDLNLDVNQGFENLSDGRVGRGFDLNLKFPEDEVVNMEAREGQLVSNESVEARVQTSVDLVEDNKVGILFNVKSEKGKSVNVEIEEHPLSENCGMEFGGEDLIPFNSQMKRRGRKRSEAATNNIEAVPASPELVKVSVETDRMCLEMESIQETPLPNGTDNDNDVLGAITRGRRGRKRKEQQGKDFTLSTPETGLRRSSRRAKMVSAEPDQVPHAEEIDGINHHLLSPAISAVSDEKLMAPSHGLSQDHVLPPPKVELPPSSCDLDLDGASMFSVVSVYSFLRSFSTLLFLSPFEPGDFVMSIKSNDSTLLLDSIHVSLLRALRKHMESLSEEGSVTASNCLRSLNWEFLDLITWPMFVVEYFLLHSPGHVPGFDVCQLKFFYEDYYKLSASAKIEILQHLCDDVVEVDAFRTELIKRALATDRQTDLERSVKHESLKKRKAGMDAASNSCITEEEAEDPLDWNSDECSLCKMDGNLICCDGCPAAFHSRCVGVVSNELPEGEWYCPECIIGKDKPWLKVGKLVRGAELMGIDPYQRAFYSCCGYLVVFDTCDDKISWSYTGNDLLTLIEALESSPITYATIINSICKQWNIVRGVGGARNDLDARSSSIQSSFPRKGQICEMHVSPLESLNKNEAFAEKRSLAKFMVLTNCCAEPENAKVDNHLASSEGSAEVSQTFSQIDTSKERWLNGSKRRTKISDHCSNAGKLADTGDQYMALASVNVGKGKNISSDSCGCVPDTAYSSQVFSQVKHVNYVNSYEFARIASSFYEEWTSKSSDKMSEGVPMASDEIIARQLKIVSNKIADFSWANIQKSNMNLMKERCGWCIYCRVPEEEKDCLFIMICSFPAIENYASEVLGVQSRKNIKSHLVDVMCHIICIEDHLQGLLLGPWLNQHYSMLWRTGVLGMADMTSLKEFLLELEMNLHHRAFSADWQKHMDAVSSMGSACHIVKSSSRFSSKHGFGRKRANPSKVETSQSSNAVTGLTLLWWRGGKGSRMLFNWKGLPRCLVSKAARQGGCKKIQGILYPEIGEYAKRTKSASWRAAVERSRSVHQLALQVRDLNANIKWDDIGNTNPLLKMDKDSKKPARSFKKVIIRRKISEGGTVKYLLDFGKRRFIPDVVARHGFSVEDLSSVRKKYWLEESHVPLHLLKSFEEKRIARKSNVVHSGKLRESAGMMRKPFKREGFLYLFSRAERAENYQCGHCRKDVHIREAVSCQHCKGFFHRRHVQKSAGSIAAECTYTCHKCPSDEFVKIDGRKRKSEPTEDKKNTSKRLKSLNQGKGKGRGRPKGSGKGKGKGKKSVNSKKTTKVPMAVPLRRSARNAARIAKRSLQSIKAKGRKRGRKPKSVKDTSNAPTSISLKKKRAPVNSSFWLNGLWLSRIPGDARVTEFRSRMLLVLPREVIDDNPLCSLCGELDRKSELIYVACETCRAWFHGDALNITADSANNVIGYKCYGCLKKRPPVCPHHGLSRSSESGVVSKSDANVERTGNDSNCLAHIEDIPADQRSDSNDEAKDSVLTVNMEKLEQSDQREKV